MIETIVNYKCDNCNSAMKEYEYHDSTKIFIKVEVPNQKCGAGECNGVHMVICDKCSNELGIVNSIIHNGYGSQRRLGEAIEKCKFKILDMFFKKKKA